MRAPVRATMEVVELQKGNLPISAFMDRHAYESDGVILINRIKPHTDFTGRYESGLMKMALIGLGKREERLRFINSASTDYASSSHPVHAEYLRKARFSAALVSLRTPTTARWS